jgi:SAM-dependent methyltransferase
MINRRLSFYFPRLRQLLTRISYEYLSMLDKNAYLLFMNYGYANLDSNEAHLELAAKDERHRYPIQLYDHIASSIDWSGLEGLEVSCGRGGGAHYIMQHYHPKSITGVDFSTQAISFCNRYYSVEGLAFAHGDAESLRFPNHSFDVVINLEASLYYPNVERFFRNVVRVLRPGGYFLYADMRYVEEIEVWRMQLRSTGLKCLSEEDITQNVLRALDLDHHHKRTVIEQYVPKLFHKPFYLWSGITGADLARDESKAGTRVYLSFVFRKKDAVDKN